MAIEMSQGPSESRISVTGRLVIDSSLRFRALLLKAIRKTTSAVLVVDLSALSYLDTSGVATRSRRRASRPLTGCVCVIGLTGEFKDARADY
jgi:hypothetical protein